MNLLEIAGVIFGGFFGLIFIAVASDSIGCKFNQWKRERTRKFLKDSIKSHYERYWGGKEEWNSEDALAFAEDFYWSEWKKR